MNFDFDGDLLKKIRRWTEGPLPEDLWAKTLELSDRLDDAIAPIITEPDYMTGRVTDLTVDICGPDKLWDFHPEGKQHCYPRGSKCRICILGGPLPNGRTFMSLFGGGHEAGHNETDVDHLCEGLEQQGLWEEAYGQGGRLDAELGPMIIDPMHFERHDLRMRLWLCGPERLRRLAENPQERPEAVDGRLDVFLLGGPMPNGRTYLSQGDLGQILVRHITGVANPCVGL